MRCKKAGLPFVSTSSAGKANSEPKSRKRKFETTGEQCDIHQGFSGEGSTDYALASIKLEVTEPDDTAQAYENKVLVSDEAVASTSSIEDSPLVHIKTEEAEIKSEICEVKIEEDENNDITPFVDNNTNDPLELNQANSNQISDLVPNNNFIKDKWSHLEHGLNIPRTWLMHRIGSAMIVICEMVDIHGNALIKKKIVLDSDGKVDCYIFNHVCKMGLDLKSFQDLNNLIAALSSVPVCYGAMSIHQLPGFRNDFYEKDNSSDMWRHKRCTYKLERKEEVQCRFCSCVLEHV